jgi:hypothetical protein
VSSIFSENWDGVTAPAIPAGFNQQDIDGFEIVTSTSGATPLSSPNILKLAGSSGLASFRTITFGTLDGAGGNVQVTGTGQFGSGGGISNSEFAVFARSNQSTTSYTSSTFYEFRVSGANAAFEINAFHAGTSTPIFSVATSELASGVFYEIQATLSGPTLQAVVTRLSDGFFLNMATGAFQAGSSSTTQTDSSITGEGFIGWSANAIGAASVFGDDLSAATAGLSFAAVTEGGDVFAASATAAESASFATTEAHDTLAASGQFAAPATLASTEAHDAFAGPGHFAASGSLAQTAGPDSLAGSAHFTAPGVIAPTETHDTFAGSATFVTGTTLSTTERHDVFASGSLDTLSVLGPTAAGDSFAAAAATDDVGTLAPTERHDVMSSFALVSPALHAREGGDIFAGSGTSTGMTATLSGTGAGDTFSAGGGFSFDTRGQLVGIEAQDLFAWLATQSSSAALNAVESGDRLAATSVVGSTGTLDVVESGDSFAGGQVVVQYHVYANTGAGDPINYDSPIAATTATTFTTSPLSFPGTWSFAVRAFDVFGEEQNLDCALSIVLNTAGQDVTNQPLPPTAIRGIALVGGDIRVEWFYPPTTGFRAPTGFHVYAGTGGTPNYATPVATVLFSAGFGSAFQVDVTGFIGGGVYTIGVRAFNATAEEANTNTVVVTAIATGPTAVVGLTAAATATA